MNLSTKHLIIISIVIALLFLCLFLIKPKKEGYKDLKQVKFYNVDNKILEMKPEEEKSILDGEHKDNINLVEVPNKVYAIIYVNPDFSGTHFLLPPGTHNIDFVTQVRSLKVFSLHAKSIILGKKRYFEENEEDKSNIIMDQNQPDMTKAKEVNGNEEHNFKTGIQAIYVCPDTRLLLYKESDYTSHYKKVDSGVVQDINKLWYQDGQKITEQVSSLKIIPYLPETNYKLMKCDDSSSGQLCPSDGPGWQNISGNVKHIDSNEFFMIGIDKANNLWIKQEGDIWKKPAVQSKFIDATLAGAVIWALNINGEVEYSEDVGETWTNLTNTGLKVNYQGNSEYELLGKQINSRGGKVAVVDYYNRIYIIELDGTKYVAKHFNGSEHEFRVAWGSPKNLSVGKDNNIYKVNNYGEIIKHDPTKIVNDKWRQSTKFPSLSEGKYGFSNVDANSDNILGVSEYNKLYQYNQGNNTWDKINGHINKVVRAGKSLLGIKTNKTGVRLIGNSPKQIKTQIDMIAGAYEDGAVIDQTYAVGILNLKVRPTGIKPFDGEKTLLVPPGYQVTAFLSRFSGLGTKYRAGTYTVPANKNSYFVEKVPLIRYVRIEKTGSFITLAEVEIYDHRNINVAKNKRVYNSGIYKVNDFPADEFKPENAVNGNTEGSYRILRNEKLRNLNKNTLLEKIGYKISNPKLHITPPYSNVSSWWEIDLGDEYDIDRIVIHNRTTDPTSIFNNGYDGKEYLSNAHITKYDPNPNRKVPDISVRDLYGAKILLFDKTHNLAHTTNYGGHKKGNLPIDPSNDQDEEYDTFIRFKSFNLLNLDLTVDRVKIVEPTPVGEQRWLTFSHLDLYNMNNTNVATEDYGSAKQSGTIESKTPSEYTDVNGSKWSVSNNFQSVTGEANIAIRKDNRHGISYLNGIVRTKKGTNTDPSWWQFTLNDPTKIKQLDIYFQTTHPADYKGESSRDKTNKIIHLQQKVGDTYKTIYQFKTGDADDSNNPAIEVISRRRKILPITYNYKYIKSPIKYIEIQAGPEAQSLMFAGLEAFDKSKIISLNATTIMTNENNKFPAKNGIRRGNGLRDNSNSVRSLSKSGSETLAWRLILNSPQEIKMVDLYSLWDPLNYINPDEKNKTFTGGLLKGAKIKLFNDKEELVKEFTFPTDTIDSIKTVSGYYLSYKDSTGEWQYQYLNPDKTPRKNSAGEIMQTPVYGSRCMFFNLTDIIYPNEQSFPEPTPEPTIANITLAPQSTQTVGQYLDEVQDKIDEEPDWTPKPTLSRENAAKLTTGGVRSIFINPPFPSKFQEKITGKQTCQITGDCQIDIEFPTK